MHWWYGFNSHVLFQSMTCWCLRTVCQTYSKEVWKTKGEMKPSSCLPSGSTAWPLPLCTASSTLKTTTSTWSSAFKPNWARVSYINSNCRLSYLLLTAAFLCISLLPLVCLSASSLRLQWLYVTRSLTADTPHPASTMPPWQTARITMWCYTAEGCSVGPLASTSM